MWTSTLDLDPKRVLLTRLLGRFWRGAYFSSFAPLRVENLPRPTLAASSWVRVRNRLAGICGSDLHLVSADGDLSISLAALPGHKQMYPGHEVVGEVVEIGDTVEHLRVGDRVVLQHGPNCISNGAQPVCRFCADGFYNLCEYGTLPGPHAIGGGWSEEMVLPEQQLYRVPSWMSDEQAVLLEPTAVALHAVLRALPRADSQALIIGAGAIGLLTLQILHALAPEVEISVLARHPFQIEQATRLGASHIIYTHDSYLGVQTVTNAQPFKGWFGNRTLVGGYETIFDTIGTRRTLHHALRWACARANVVLVGVHLHPMYIDLTPIWNQEIKLIGSMSHGLEHWPPRSGQPHSSFDLVADLMRNDQIAPEQLLTHRFALTDYQQALRTAMGKGQTHAIKVVFDYSLAPSPVVPNVRASAHSRHPFATTRQPETPMPEPSQLSSTPSTEGEEETAKFVRPSQELPTAPTNTESDKTASMPALKRKHGSRKETLVDAGAPYVKEQKSEPLLTTPSTSDLDADEPSTSIPAEPVPSTPYTFEQPVTPAIKEQKSEPLLSTPSTSEMPAVKVPQETERPGEALPPIPAATPIEPLPSTPEEQAEEALPLLPDTPPEEVPAPAPVVEPAQLNDFPASDSTPPPTLEQEAEPLPSTNAIEESPAEPGPVFAFSSDHNSDLPPSTAEDMREEHPLAASTPTPEPVTNSQDSVPTETPQAQVGQSEEPLPGEAPQPEQSPDPAPTAAPRKPRARRRKKNTAPE